MTEFNQRKRRPERTAESRVSSATVDKCKEHYLHCCSCLSVCRVTCMCKVILKIIPVLEALIRQEFKARSHIHTSQRDPSSSIDMNSLFS